MKTAEPSLLGVHPDQIKLTALQAERLGALNDVDAGELIGLSVAQISEKFRFRIDPMLLFFRRICGKVVKKDPVTGIEYPVAYATVHVEDTDCSFLGYFPVAGKYSWYFPLKCRREVIGTVKTDKCGNFCVYVPRWDIDWILKWRKERLCFPVIFERPTLVDILEDLIPREVIPFPFPRPGPGPDPAPFLRHDRGQLLATVEQRLGRDTARRLGVALSRLSFGASTLDVIDLLQDDAFEMPLAPPLPSEFRMVEHGIEQRKGANSAVQRLSMEGVRASIGARLKMNAEALSKFDLRQFIGPFRRCVDIFVPEWVPIIDIPDITFRVTQDVNGDGVEETIYSEGFFRVRWDANNLPPVKLIASPMAISIPECGEIIDIPCGNVPAIYRAGRMPVRGDPTMYDPVAGYALRPNRPHPAGNPVDPLPNPDARSPFYGVVPIYGCVDVGTSATQYRVLDSYNGGPFLPVLDQSWWVTRLDAAGMVTQYHHVLPAANGWYDIVIPKGSNPNDWEPPKLVLDWNTYQTGNGKHVLRIELGSGGAPLTPQPATDTVAFHVDNSYPATSFQVEYRKNGVGPFQPLVFPCPVVRRGTLAQNLEFRVSFTASANHLRDVSMGGGGCGGGEINYVSGAPADWFPAPALNPTGVAHWHETPGDNSVVITAFFSLDAGALQGTYSFSAWAASRAFNPAGGDSGHLQTPMYEYDPADIHVTPSFLFSVINAD
ncbi:MAG: hypothetical protein IPJ48_10175 [Propionivibrio sp.]|uniref:Uncharacterized protein n=1 Tax=Candidatus Propionivibrio dominans TaxID=2954373 RepID=A0A9D7I8S6_9RHOO|nr:hypothetical protein [Candidatus Propionivibrio dominans]